MASNFVPASKQVDEKMNTIQHLQDKIVEKKLEEIRNPFKKTFTESLVRKNPDFKKLQEEEEEARTRVNRVVENSVQSAFQRLHLGIPDDINKWEFGDGDRSLLTGKELNYIRTLWATGGDYSIDSPILSQWARDCLAGDLAKIKAHLEQEPQLLDRRESLLRMNGLLHAVNGARGLIPGISIKGNRHLKCAIYLVEQGCDVDCKDLGGHTPLHHCTGAYGNSTTLVIADFLLSRGANINMLNRFGCTPLFSPIMSGKVPCVEWLLNNGADYNICDPDGIGPVQLGRCNSELGKLFSIASQKVNKAAKNASKQAGTYHACVVCGQSNNCKRCSACFLTWYCSQKCQKEDWGKHKKACKETRSEYLVANLKKQIITNLSRLTGTVATATPSNILKGKTQFVVKVQVPLSKAGCMDLMVYNKEKTIFGSLSTDQPAYPLLLKTIEEKGVCGGVKGYFYAFYEETVGLKINASNILPPETW